MIIYIAENECPPLVAVTHRAVERHLLGADFIITYKLNLGGLDLYEGLFASSLLVLASFFSPQEISWKTRILGTAYLHTVMCEGCKIKRPKSGKDSISSRAAMHGPNLVKISVRASYYFSEIVILELGWFCSMQKAVKFRFMHFFFLQVNRLALKVTCAGKGVENLTGWH